jgi:hypothetical protein
MKNLHSYNEFVNEGILNFFKKLLFGVDKEYAPKLEEYIKRIKNAKNINDVSNTLKLYFDTNKSEFEKRLEDDADVYQIRKTLYDNFKVLYTATQVVVEKVGDTEFTLPKIYATAPPKTKKLFEMDAPTYMKNLASYINDLMVNDLGKKAGIDTKTLTDMFKQNPNPEVEVKPVPTANETLLFEADATPPASTTPTPPATTNPTTPETTNPTTPETAETPKTGTEEKKEDKTQITADHIESLKEQSTKFTEDTFYNQVSKKMNETVNRIKNKPSDVDRLAKIMKGSDNEESKKAILNAVKDADKMKLTKVRDALGKTKDEIPL